MNQQEAESIVNDAYRGLFRGEISVPGPNGKPVVQKLLHNNAFSLILKASDQLAVGAGATETHGAWDQLCAIAGSLGPECGLRVATEMWNALSVAQVSENRWVHKGLPLFRMWGLYRDLGRDWERRRFALLTLIEDALRDTVDGNFKPDDSGAYFQAQAQFGLDERQLNQFGIDVLRIDGNKKDVHSWCELILEQLLTESSLAASLQEAGMVSSTVSVPVGSPTMLRELSSGHITIPVLTKAGSSLEMLASLVFGALPGARQQRNLKGLFETDVLVDLVANNLLSQRFGRYIVVECKDWDSRLDISIVSKLVATLHLAGCSTGIFFSKEGLTGQDDFTAATRLAVASFLKVGLTILVLSESDLDALREGQNLATILIQKQVENQMMVRMDN